MISIRFLVELEEKVIRILELWSALRLARKVW